MGDKRKNRLGRFFTGAGLIMIASATLLLTYNLWDNRRAEESQEKILAEYLSENKKASEVPSDPDGEAANSQNIPDYLLDPDMEMPEFTLSSLGDISCIGILEIPSLDLKLPVISRWSYPALKLSPCSGCPAYR